MTEKRFTMSQNGNFHTVRDTVEKKPLGMFEFKENEFPVYACFHHIIDLLNEFYDENEQLKQQLNKIFVLIDIKQNISKENMEEWAFKDVPASTSREYYYSGMLDACMQLRDEILNGDVE